jgi:parallel beta-helix repeat protein
MPEHMTSHHWLIEKNTFTRNWKAIRIAAWQDHGIRNLEKETDDEPIYRPHDHLIRENDIQDNRIGIDLEQCDRTEITRNIIHRNVEANLREQDTSETRYENNLGPRGAYL